MRSARCAVGPHETRRVSAHLHGRLGRRKRLLGEFHPQARDERRFVTGRGSKYLQMNTSHQISSGHAMLVAEVVGTGDPVVFLHANVCDRRIWRGQLDGIGIRRKAIGYDRRGFGETRAEPEDFSAVADLMAVLDATAAGESAVLVGRSLAGTLAANGCRAL